MERVPLYCVDKYGRETFDQEYTYNLTLEKLYDMTFDFAVEDSPAAFEDVRTGRRPTGALRSFVNL